MSYLFNKININNKLNRYYYMFQGSSCFRVNCLPLGAKLVKGKVDKPL